jgi:hypothetical protein
MLGIDHTQYLRMTYYCLVRIGGRRKISGDTCAKKVEVAGQLITM